MSVNDTGQVWVLREAVAALDAKQKAESRALAEALSRLPEDIESQPFALAQVFPDALGREDFRQVKLTKTGKEVAASTAVLVSANPEESSTAQDNTALMWAAHALVYMPSSSFLPRSLRQPSRPPRPRLAFLALRLS